MKPDEQGTPTKAPAPGTAASSPLAHVRRRPDGRYEAWVCAGTFDSEDQARQTAAKTALDAARLSSLEQLVVQVTENRVAASNMFYEQEDRFLLDVCAESAVAFKTVSLWNESQGWPGFPRAWKSFRSAWNKWITGPRRFPAMRGKAASFYQHSKKIFLTGLKLGRGETKEFYQTYRLLLFAAATLGDVEFFKALRQAKRGRLREQMVQSRLLGAWMPAALWASEAPATAAFLRQVGVWEYQPADAPMSVRAIRSQLRLWHDPRPRIKGWTGDGQPIFRS